MPAATSTITSTSAAEATARIRSLSSMPSRLGVSELARSTGWRKDLSKNGCLEVTDRSDTVFYALDPAYLDALLSYIEQLEDELEQAEITALLHKRGTQEFLSGPELADAAKQLLVTEASSIQEFLDGDR